MKNSKKAMTMTVEWFNTHRPEGTVITSVTPPPTEGALLQRASGYEKSTGHRILWDSNGRASFLRYEATGEMAHVENEYWDSFESTPLELVAAEDYDVETEAYPMCNETYWTIINWLTKAETDKMATHVLCVSSTCRIVQLSTNRKALLAKMGDNKTLQVLTIRQYIQALRAWRLRA